MLSLSALYIYVLCKVLYFILSEDDFEIKSKIYSLKLRLVLKTELVEGNQGGVVFQHSWNSISHGRSISVRQVPLLNSETEFGKLHGIDI